MAIDEKALFERFDKVIVLLEEIAKPPSVTTRIMNGIATGAGILGVITIIDVIRNWFGG